MGRQYTYEQDMAWHNKLPAKRASSVLILRDGDHVFMLKDDYKPHWTFPGGVVDPGESPLAAAIRETHEEVGVRVPDEAVRFMSVTYVPEQHGFLDRLHFFFLTEAVSRSAAVSPQKGIEAHDWTPITRIAELAGGRPTYARVQEMLLADTYEAYFEAEIIK